ncbi:tRNA-splicing endonuclease subunit sen54 [Emydomyces testavorans]|uniref:tRNA-splicing endonuclease subunit sen54 n=1 Tax=Emydomyces testavorans TaxID=2070801 RepID=A0AAF0DDZ6_9EURO|nr:tRNA-splicing endonuclease subunit sen54 [Emydomyces testavorans]
MADADEDGLLRPTSSPDPAAHADQDISDEAQDFRFLSNVSFLSDPTQQSLPRRGEKDFEPNPTLHQADTLAASRNAMHNALMFPRLHNPKNKVVGIFCPQGALEPLSSRTGTAGHGSSTQSVPMEGSNSSEEGTTGDARNEMETARQVYRPRGDDLCVCVPNPRGQHFRTMGQADQFNRVWLLPEEALYLLERGSLDIRWPVELRNDEGMVDAMDAVEQGVPMSLQAAYACLIGQGGLSIERYTVYAGLKRGGYVVIRAEGWSAKQSEITKTTRAPNQFQGQFGESGAVGVLGLLSRILNSINNFRSTCSTAHGPVTGEIYRTLSIIPAFNPDTPDSDPKVIESTACSTSPYRLAFNVYKPSTSFRKSSPGTPDFRLAVINARTHPNLPSLTELSALLASTPLAPPRGEKLDRLMYLRLRHGWRNVILGVVDQGVVSFLRVADAGFIKEPLYDQKSTIGPGGKGSRRPPGKKGGR